MVRDSELRELHHFEAEHAMSEAVGLIDKTLLTAILQTFPADVRGGSQDDDRQPTGDDARDITLGIISALVAEDITAVSDLVYALAFIDGHQGEEVARAIARGTRVRKEITTGGNDA